MAKKIFHCVQYDKKGTVFKALSFGEYLGEVS